jgi:polysaccharide export outer membrane protein
MKRLVTILMLCAPLGWALPAAAEASQNRTSYRIGPMDLLAVRVFEVPELNLEARVSEAGNIILPLIGDVPVNGLTAAEVKIRLKALLESKYIQRASVSVQVREFRSRPISVIGAVSRPGPLAFSGRLTLMEALTAAGGLAASHGNFIYIFRRAENGLSDQLSVLVEDLMARAAPRANIPIFANDLINVPATAKVTIFFIGEVQSAGALSFQSTERITLLSAISRAGGLSDRASKKILIRRDSAAAEPVEMVVSYKEIVSGKVPDPILQAGDIVVVKRSFL